MSSSDQFDDLASRQPVTRARLVRVMSRYLPKLIFNILRGHSNIEVFGAPDVHSVKDDRISYTYIGHATVHINLLGKSIITDPNFSKRLVITKRLVDMPIEPAELLPINLALISHAHRDHFDFESVKMLNPDISIIVPKGVSPYVKELGFDKVFELKLWESMEIEGMKVTGVPAKHWGYRFKRWDLGFLGYVVERKGRSFYFAGDTAYFDGFKEIGKRFAPEVSLFPISCYDPPPFQRNHISPWDAVKAIEELKTNIMIPIHWGTFILSMEPPDEPPVVFVEAAKDAGIEDKAKVLRHGEMLVLD